MKEESYQWTFEVNDVVKFEETTITVTANTYEDAIKKIRGLKLPQLRTFNDVEEGMRLTQVFEIIDDFEDEEDFPQLKDDED